MHGVGYIHNPPKEFLDIVKKGTARPEVVLGEFQTDFQLFEAVHNATPADYREARSDKKVTYKTLLYLKLYRMGNRAMTIEYPGCRGFMVVNQYLPARPLCDLFDGHGAYRGMFMMAFPDDVSWEEAEQLVGQLLYYAEFRGNSASGTVNPKDGHE
jgi:hypothetical protein